MDRQCSSCGGFCKKSGCERENVKSEQEPVAVVSGYYGGQCVIMPLDPARIFNLNTALYIAPPQRECAGTAHDRGEWQGLTFDDWPLPQYEYSADFQIGAQWAEAKLKAKNAC